MDPWPFRNLVLRTPRLELRPDDDEGLAELVDVTLDGIHPPDSMPFGVEWTDAPRDKLGINTLQHYWRVRASLVPERWTLNFLVRLDGRVVGTQGLGADDFPILREVTSGSWLGLRYQGQGIGTEMRAAVLMFAFDHLGAVAARSSAFNDNSASHGVSRKLGYRPDGTFTQIRRGEPAEQTRLLLTPAAFRRPDWTLECGGVEPCLALLTGQEATD
ncbi:GNAT family N-acetyltransferase [Saccharothrix sp. ALI-22-I]|uniref:GNAT family N-acetyltransferase n=1 Tax=Saccharothrix sp. ALI-22-I TaxID=1933778 RepID=UPI00097CA274|nr:GNAT family protein [Saccharothrix sp. ALI-22-I]ONI82004.1 GNAT family N-acetyltransferase [Saccharothrix sp. ALI-22-I]